MRVFHTYYIYVCILNTRTLTPWYSTIQGGILCFIRIIVLHPNSFFYVSEHRLFPSHMLSLEKAMATYSSALAWKIPGTEEPGRLQSMELGRVGHDWVDFTFTFHFHALEKEMAAHSSVLAWRIPGMGEPGGLPSMGSHRAGHDWSDLAAAAAAYVIIHYLFTYLVSGSFYLEN